MNPYTPAYEYQLAHIHEDKGPQTNVASVLLMCITTGAVVLRLVAQRMVQRSLAWDDYCAIIALASKSSGVRVQSLISSLGNGSGALWYSYSM